MWVMYVAQNVWRRCVLLDRRPHSYGASALRSQNLSRAVEVRYERAPCELCMSSKKRAPLKQMFHPHASDD